MKHQICRTMLAVAAVAAGIYLSACGKSQDPTDSVFDEAEDAIATDATETIIKTAQIEYEFGDGRTSTVRFQAPDDVRIDVVNEEDSAVFCLRGEVIDMTQDDIKEMHGALLQTLPFKVDFQKIFTDAKLQDGTEDVCGEECKVIQAVFRLEPGIKAKIWIGTYTDLLRQFEVTREDGVYTMQYFDYATFDDVTIPSEMFRFTPDGSAKLSLVSFETNVEIPDSVFRKPETLNIAEGEE